MIGVDTNILARLFLEDDPEQSALATKFLSDRTADDPAFIGSVVLAEFVWLLTSRYGFSVDAVHVALDAIFVSANVVLEYEDAIRTAVAQAREANADVADAIIAAVATENACSSVVTFDKTVAKRVPGMQLLK